MADGTLLYSSHKRTYRKTKLDLIRSNMQIIFTIATLALISLGAVNAFVPHTANNRRVTSVAHSPSQSHQELYDAEEGAAFEARGLSDAGMEAAALERCVWKDT